MGAAIQLGVFAILAGFAFFSAAVKIMREYERGIIFRLGRYVGVKGPGTPLGVGHGGMSRRYGRGTPGALALHLEWCPNIVI